MPLVDRRRLVQSTLPPGAGDFHIVPPSPACNLEPQGPSRVPSQGRGSVGFTPPLISHDSFPQPPGMPV